MEGPADDARPVAAEEEAARFAVWGSVAVAGGLAEETVLDATGPGVLAKAVATSRQEA